MNTESLHALAEALFREALALPPEQRTQLLDARCAAGTPLRDEVESLLAHCDAAHDFLEVPADLSDMVTHDVERNLRVETARFRPGRRVGPYTVGRLLGEGGMAEVYQAEQAEPLRRTVALKVVKPGMDSRAVLARFQTERRALALMAHPNIATIYDAGVTDEGFPYFAMELVDGPTISAFCDRERLTVAQRVELLLLMCDGVQHAHQKGIVHRDLKPSNVLVSTPGGRPVPKIIDFGIAKAIALPPGESWVHTEPGTRLGTPEYMSPEQARLALGHDDVDTRADIYAIGMLLYELVAGDLPFPREELRARLHESGWTDRLRDPPAPSRRLQQLHQRATETAMLRRVSPTTLLRCLRGDLDAIAQRAIAPERERRYATVSELSGDLRRLLAHEPVEARAPGRLYRLGKTARRYRVAVAAAAVVFVALMAATLFTTAAWRREGRAHRAEHEARLRASMAAQQATESARLAEFRLHELLRLSDLKRLRDAMSEADRLWPALPDKVPAMQIWLTERARPLAGRAAEHRSTLARLLEEEAAGIVPDQGDAAQRQWQKDLLMELIAGLEAFTHPNPHVGTVAGVSARLQQAMQLEERSVSGAAAAAAWRRAIEAIAESPRYGGLRLRPQMGLLPLGEDPVSGLWEFAHLLTGSPVGRDPTTRALHLTEQDGVVLVLLPAASFTMGTPGAGTDLCEDPQAAPNEAPALSVALDPFFISKYELTQAQWQRMTGVNPSHYVAGATIGISGNPSTATFLHPVENVSWEDCDLWLPRVALVLPSEAQWEYAARGGTSSTWWTGSQRESLRGAANLADQAARRDGATWPSISDWPDLDDGWAGTAPVGSFRCNPFGLFDVTGNLWEWCRDAMLMYSDPMAEGDGLRTAPEIPDRVLRGGSYTTRAASLRSANRIALPARTADATIGVRPARPLDG